MTCHLPYIFIIIACILSHTRWLNLWSSWSSASCSSSFLSFKGSLFFKYGSYEEPSSLLITNELFWLTLSYLLSSAILFYTFNYLVCLVNKPFIPLTRAFVSFLILDMPLIGWARTAVILMFESLNDSPSLFRLCFSMLDCDVDWSWSYFWV